MPRVVKLIETESRIAVTRGWGRGMGSSCFILLILFNGYRVSVLQDDQSPGDVCWCWLHNNVHILDTTELYT